MKKLISVLVMLAFCTATLFVSSCTSKPNEEQIQALEEARSAALAAEKDCSDKKSERQGEEAKVKTKKAALEKAKAEKEKVAQGVAARKAEATQ